MESVSSHTAPCLHSTSTAVKCGPKVMYYNAQSLTPNINELYIQCMNRQSDIVCIVESWLDGTILDKELSLPGYKLYRWDRNRHGGGVAIYACRHITYQQGSARRWSKAPGILVLVYLFIYVIWYILHQSVLSTPIISSTHF